MPIQEIADNLFFFQRGYLNGNHLAYRFEDGRAVLIDTGYITHTEETLRLLKKTGIRPERTELIVNTHCHCDHIGANRTIQELSGCGALLSVPGKLFMDHCDDLATWWRYFNQEAAFFSATGALREGDRLSIGPHEFSILRTPGHSVDSIALYLEREKTLISGDTLWERDVAVINERIEGRSALCCLLESLDKLEGLQVETVCPGHGRPFNDLAAAIARSREILSGFIEDRRELGFDLLRKLVVFTLLMRGPQSEDAFASDLLETGWYADTVRSYLKADPDETYSRVLGDLCSRKAVRCEKGRVWTEVKP